VFDDSADVGDHDGLAVLVVGRTDTHVRLDCAEV
jgi:hypothetical protein